MSTPDNVQLTSLTELQSTRDSGGAWYEVVVMDGRNRVGLICALPGTPPDPHIHPDYNEWWINIGGQTQLQLGQYEPLLATWGDIVIAPAGYCHDIRSKGTEHARRLHVSHPNSNHDIRGIAPNRYVPVDYSVPMPNLLHTRYEDLRGKNGLQVAWSQVIVEDGRNRATMVQACTGDTTEPHKSQTDEWWVLLDGTASLHTNKGDVHMARGDIVLVEGNTSYSVTTTSTEPSVRIVVTAP